MFIFASMAANRNGQKSVYAEYGFGYNANYDLVDGTTNARSDGVQVGSGTNDPISTVAYSWTKVKAGGPAGGSMTYAALRSDGALFVWGDNAYGQKGLQNTVQYNPTSPVITTYFKPKLLDSATTFVGTFTGGVHFTTGYTEAIARNCFLVKSDNTLVAWGYNSYGSVSLDGTTASGKTSPVSVGTNAWNYISSNGRGTNAGIATTGRLYTWGYNDSTAYNLGIGVTNSYIGATSVVIGSSFSAVGVGDYHGFALDTNCRLFFWGQGSVGNGSAGTATGVYTNGVNTYRTSPIVFSATSSYTALAVADNHVALLDAAGKLWVIGANDVGQLGTNDLTAKSALTQVGIGISFISVSVGAHITSAIDSDGNWWQSGWDINSYGIHGPNVAPGSIISSFTIVGSAGDVVYKKVSNNTFNVYLLSTDNDLYGLGEGHGVGDGWGVHRSSPVLIASGMTSPIIPTVQRGFSTYIDNGHAYHWGAIGSQSVYGTMAPLIDDPIRQVPGSWSNVEVGYQCLYMTKSSTGQLYACGLNTNGQLGDNSVLNRSSPTLVAGTVTSFKSIAAGVQHVVALSTSGSNLYTWGLNSSGQLGTGVVTSRSSPALIGTSSWLAVGAGSGYSGAILSNGSTLYMWGANNTGQLGDNSIVSKSSPVLISGGPGSGWQAISLSHATVSPHALGVTTNGVAYAWGGNLAYKLGNTGFTATQNASSPVVVNTLSSSWTAVSAGVSHSVGLTINGKAIGWGKNTYGACGSTNVGGNSYGGSFGPVGSQVAVVAGADASFLVNRYP